MITKDFLLAGNAIFTVSNADGLYYTFNVVRKEFDSGARYFVNLLTGADNTSDYTYIGMLNQESGDVFPTRASRFTVGCTPMRVAKWAIRQVFLSKELPEGYAIQHAGRCGRCGRMLTTPESIATGLGPICVEKAF